MADNSALLGLLHARGIVWLCKIVGGSLRLQAEPLRTGTSESLNAAAPCDTRLAPTPLPGTGF
jgi:hypothetical protein